MGNISNLFGGDFTPPPEKQSGPQTPPHEQIIDAIARAGYEPPKEIIFDGKIHRFSTDGRPRRDDGWYVAYDGKIHAGAFGSWREGSSHNWRADIGRDYTTAEEMEYAQRMKAMRAQRDAEASKRKASAAESCDQIWAGAGDANNDHPYLAAKNVGNHGLKVTGDGRLIVPMLSPEGEIASLQYIPADGKNKRYHGGGRKEGVFYSLLGDSSTVCIAEGYATGASVFEATGHTTYIAFDAGNLSAVAVMAREHHQNADIVLIADNDPPAPNSENPGLEAAKKAADACRGRYVCPPDVGTDANDYANAGGSIQALIQPPSSDWLVQADDFASEPSPIRWLIKNHIQREALHMVHGPSGGGKTFLVLDQCLSIAAKMDSWCGHNVRHGTVVYLAGEGHHGLRGRVAAWKQYHRVEKLDMWLSKAGTDLNTPQGYSHVTSAIDALPSQPCMIVVDTLHRFLEGDENSAQDAKTMLDACNELQRRYEAAVLLVHHTGVSDESQHRARGSSAWRGALDIEVSVVPGTDDAPMSVVQRKMKDGEIADDIHMRITSVKLPWEDEDGEAVTSAVVVQDEDWAAQKKEPDSHAKARQSIESAWLAMGDLTNGKPYLTESAWREHHKSHNQDTKPATLRQQFKRFKDALLDSKFIEIAGAGFVISDPIAASSVILAKGK